MSELTGYTCCPEDVTHVYSHDKYGDWGYDSKTKQWCGLTPYTSQAQECWSKKLGYECCKKCKVILTDSDGPWGYENHHWCGIPSSC